MPGGLGGQGRPYRQGRCRRRWRTTRALLRAWVQVSKDVPAATVCWKPRATCRAISLAGLYAERRRSEEKGQFQNISPSVCADVLCATGCAPGVAAPLLRLLQLGPQQQGAHHAAAALSGLTASRGGAEDVAACGGAAALLATLDGSWPAACMQHALTALGACPAALRIPCGSDSGNAAMSAPARGIGSSIHRPRNRAAIQCQQNGAGGVIVVQWLTCWR